MNSMGWMMGALGELLASTRELVLISIILTGQLNPKTLFSSTYQ